MKVKVEGNQIYNMTDKILETPMAVSLVQQQVETSVLEVPYQQTSSFAVKEPMEFLVIVMISMSSSPIFFFRYLVDMEILTANYSLDTAVAFCAETSLTSGDAYCTLDDTNTTSTTSATSATSSVTSGTSSTTSVAATSITTDAASTTTTSTPLYGNTTAIGSSTTVVTICSTCTATLPGTTITGDGVGGASTITTVVAASTSTASSNGGSGSGSTTESGSSSGTSTGSTATASYAGDASGIQTPRGLGIGASIMACLLAWVMI